MDQLQVRVVAEQGVFLSTDQDGEIPLAAPGPLGLYYQDTRFLSGLELRINGQRLAPLGVDEHGYAATFTYGAAAERAGALSAGLVLRRTRYIRAAEGEVALHERLILTNYDRAPQTLTLSLAFAADFQDMFSVRGFAPLAPGRHHAPALPQPGAIVFGYRGRDGREQHAQCTLAPAPTEVTVSAPATEGPWSVPGVLASYALSLEPRQPLTIDVTVRPVADAAPAMAPAPLSFDAGLAALRRAHEEWAAKECTQIETDDAALNRAIRQSLRDLRLLLLDLPTGLYPTAGIPWFAVPFGRDALITALQTLLVTPAIAAGTLRYLAAHQGQHHDPRRDEEPGKIMHEMRSGESVRTGLLAFDPYYGTVDATPLFLVVLGRALPWLDDPALLTELELAVRGALHWLDHDGDLDGEGLIEFQRKAGRGLSNQGWKDSGDALQFPDGRYPEGPIALVEVQGYAYEARLAAAGLLRRLGDADEAARQEERAAALRAHFNAAFWLPEEHCFAQALDADKRPVPAVTSNAGHALWSGIVDEEKAPLLAQRLLREDLCGGWGIRTLSSDYPSYHPLSYHNGSIWPHDTAIVAAGLKRYGYDEAAAGLLAQVTAAANGFPEARLPELYGGLPRAEGERGPVPYPVSCRPQAWAAGSLLMLLHTVLGLAPGADGASLALRPAFPPGLTRVSLRRLRIGATTRDLDIIRHPDGRYTVDGA